MFRHTCSARQNWQQQAAEYGFNFHTMYGQPYWDESAYYQFNIHQIEDDIEDPTAELHQMCLHAVDKVVNDEYWLSRFQIPEGFWQPTLDSWTANAPSLYSRLDLVYDGQSPAKLLENNADTPTSLYESGFWQWLWLEQQVDAGVLPRHADQFNSVQEKLINRFKELAVIYQTNAIHFSCCQDTDEDRGTVQYLQDCAKAAGLHAPFVYIEDIGINDAHWFTNLADNPMEFCFKLYPWEFMQREEFGELVPHSPTEWLEPLWKSVLSNKALLPLLWELFPNHPNLLPAFFADQMPAHKDGHWIKKPIFSREGANISLVDNNGEKQLSEGPYGEEGFVIQQLHPLPVFNGNHTLIGSWLIDDLPAGISIREDSQMITQDMSRYLPHIIA